MFWHSFHVFVSLDLLASVACLPALEVIVAALAALPAAWRKLAVLSLLLGLDFVAHALLASVACLAPLEVIVEALVAVPATLWKLEWLLALAGLQDIFFFLVHIGHLVNI